jgi:hypothetical protein
MNMGKKTNPFSQDDDIDAEIEETPKDPVVDLEAEEDDEEEGDPKPSRKEKKASRTWMNREEKERLERQAIEAEARAVASAQALQQVTQMAQMYARPQQQTQSDPIDAELERANAERIALDDHYAARYRDSNNPLTQEELKGFKDRAVALEDKKTMLIAEKVARRSGMQQQQSAGEQAVRAYLAANFPEASQSQQALAYAGGIQAQRAAEGKAPWSVEVIHEAMTAAEKRFAMGKYRSGAPREPDPVLRDRYVAAPRGASGGSSKGGERTVTMTKEFRQMADKAFPHIKDDGKRWRHWAKEVGQGDEE